MIKSSGIHLIFLKINTLVILLLLMRTSSFAQSENTGSIQKQFEKYNEQLLHEKVFVHTDKSAYLAGEIMWFKVYCTDANSNSLSSLSKVAYVEVTDNQQQPVLQAKIALHNGVGNGSLVLPATLHSGNFLFRAYTNLMKNSDAGFYFDQNISIINTVQTDTLPKEKSEEEFHIDFFPEGGNMVNELTGKVAFEVTDNTGRGVVCSGVIADQNNNTIVRFQTLHAGIGSFIFLPKTNITYTATITTANGKTFTQNLPPARKFGFAITVSEQQKNGRLAINIQTNTDSRTAYLFIHNKRQVKTAKLLTFSEGKSDFEISAETLGQGISHITLFDDRNQPVAERLYFKRPEQQLFISVASDRQEYEMRKKVVINLSVKDENNKPLKSEMSMAVFKTDSLPYGYKDIFSYLWMTSDLKGKIESPEYYFDNKTYEADEATDNLMLTHGWRRFKWNDVLTNQPTVLKFLPEYEGHIVSGKIINRNTGTAVSDEVAYLSVPGKNFQLYTSKSSADGTINFNTKDFYGNKLMVAQAGLNDSNLYRIDIDDPFSTDFSTEKIPPFALANNASSMLVKQSIYAQVQSIYSGAKMNYFKSFTTDTSNFYGKPQAKYLLDDYTRFPTMEEVLREYVREINVRKKRNKFFLTMVNKDDEGNAETKNPVILLDGVPQFDNGNKVANLDPLKVEKLETIGQTYFLGPARFDGIASFFTYNGDMDGFKIDSASTVIDYDALQLRREFYVPAYETSEQIGSRMPDFRNVLYWSPDIQTNASGNAETSFYTSDLAGKYAVLLQGISADGKAASKVFTFEVTKKLADK